MPKLYAFSILALRRSEKAGAKEGRTTQFTTVGYSRDKSGRNIPVIEGHQWRGGFEVKDEDMKAEIMEGVNRLGYWSGIVSYDAPDEMYLFQDATKQEVVDLGDRSVVRIPMCASIDPNGKNLPVGYDWTPSGTLPDDAFEEWPGYNAYKVHEVLMSHDTYLFEGEFNVVTNRNKIKDAIAEEGNSVADVVASLYKKKPPR